jgi:3-oxoisoapionate decarboxylase
MKIDFAIHSFCLWHHFKHAPGFDALAFADLAAAHGFTGINLSLNDENYRHLGGREPHRMDALRAHLARSGMSLEVDTSGTDPEHLRRLIAVAHRLGAKTLRFYTRHRGPVDTMIARTVADLRAVMDAAEHADITLVIENHEDFTGLQLAEIVRQVDHPHLKVLYDYGNSQMVLEDPEAALTAVLAHVKSVHMKDHVMVRAEHSPSGQIMVAGVPIGRGFVPCRNLTRRLLESGLRRLTFESVWAYSAPVVPWAEPGDGLRLGEGAFGWREPPFHPDDLILDQGAFSGAELVRMEQRALEEGLNFTKAMFAELGVTGFQAQAS